MPGLEDLYLAFLRLLVLLLDGGVLSAHVLLNP